MPCTHMSCKLKSHLLTCYNCRLCLVLRPLLHWRQFRSNVSPKEVLCSSWLVRLSPVQHVTLDTVVIRDVSTVIISRQRRPACFLTLLVLTLPRATTHPFKYLQAIQCRGLWRLLGRCMHHIPRCPDVHWRRLRSPDDGPYLPAPKVGSMQVPHLFDWSKMNSMPCTANCNHSVLMPTFSAPCCMHRCISCWLAAAPACLMNVPHASAPVHNHCQS